MLEFFKNLLFYRRCGISSFRSMLSSNTHWSLSKLPEPDNINMDYALDWMCVNNSKIKCAPKVDKAFAGEVISKITNKLFVEHSIENFLCDITDVQGLSASKSDLSKFKSMDEFAEKSCSWAFGDMDISTIRSLMSIREVWGDKQHTLRYLPPYLYLSNSGGSHRFSASRYIAGRKNIPYQLTATLKTYAVNSDVFAWLQRNFDAWMLAGDYLDDELTDYLEKTPVEWYTFDFNPSHRGDVSCSRLKLVFVRKGESYCQKMALNAFRKQGYICFIKFLENFPTNPFLTRFIQGVNRR